MLTLYSCKKKNCEGIPGGTLSISFTSYPKIGTTGNVSGMVSGDGIEQYDIALYIFVDGGFWTKPTFDAPVTKFNKCGEFSAPVTTGGDDANASKIIAFLIPVGYNPPTLSGESSIPADLTTHAAAQTSVNR